MEVAEYTEFVLLNYHTLIKIKPETELEIKSEPISTTDNTNEFNPPYIKHKVTEEDLVEISEDIKQEELDINDEHMNTDIQDLEPHSSIIQTQDVKVFQCNLCSYKYLTERKLDSHINHSHCEKLFSCNMCNFKSMFKFKAKIHAKIHQQQFKCDVCNFITVQRSRLEQHMHIHEKVAKIHEEQFECDLCNFITVQKSQLEQHMHIHEKVAKIHEEHFECDVCNFLTVQKNELEQHMHIHEKFTCNYKTENSENLQKQTNVVCGPISIRCSVCAYKTTQTAFMTNHLLMHKRQKPLKYILPQGKIT